MRRLLRLLRKILRLLWRGGSHTVVAILVLLFLLWMSLVLAAASPGGSRWLLERLVSLQTVIRFELEGGTLQDGLRLRNFRFSGKKFHLDADRLHLQLTWASLMRRELYIDTLEGEGVRLVFTGPPNPNPIRLKHPNLPFRLILGQGLLTRIAIVKPSGVMDAESLSVQNLQWLHQRLDVTQVELKHSRFFLHLGGNLHFIDNYPIQARGGIQADFLSNHRLRPADVSVAGDLGALEVRLVHGRPAPMQAIATINTLQPLLGYRGLVRWGKMNVPWYAENFGLQTRQGFAHIRGNRKGLTLLGDASLQGKFIPKGDYRWFAETDWKSLRLMPVEGRTLMGGVLSMHGDVYWRGGIAWNVQSHLSNVDLSRQWPVPRVALPVLQGVMNSEGRMSAGESSLSIEADLASNESWSAKLKSKAWPWQWHKPQHLTLVWKNLARPVPGLGDAFSAQGELDYQGILERYALSSKLSLRSPRFPEGDWKVNAGGDMHSLAANLLEYGGSAGKISGTAAVNWRQDILWSATADLSDFSNSFWLPAWPAVVSGAVDASGQLRPDNHEIGVRHINLSGQLRDQPLALQGDLLLQIKPGVALPDFKTQAFQADWGTDHVDIEGGLWSYQWDMSLNSSLQDLSLLDNRLTGSVNGVVSLQGEQAKPGISLNLIGEKLTGLGASAETFSASGYLPALALENGFLQLHAHDLAYGSRFIPDTMLVLEGSRSAHRISWQIEADRVNAEGVLEGSLSDNAAGSSDWRGKSLSSTVAVDSSVLEQDEGELPLQWLTAERQLTAGAHCWSSAPARICTTDEVVLSPQQAHAGLSLQGLEMDRFTPLFPEGLAWKGTLEGKGSVDWKQGSLPELGLTLNTRQGAIGLAQEDDEPITLPYDRLGLKMVTEGEKIRIRFETEAPHIGQGYVEAWLDPSTKPYLINGALLLEKVNLAIFKPFFPGMRHLNGEMNLSGGLSGELTGPDFYGDFTLSGGELSARDAPLDLKQIGMNIAIRGKEAKLDGSFFSGPGKALVKGLAEWRGEPSLNLHLSGTGLELRQKPTILATVNPDLNIKVEPYVVDIRGKVEVPSALLKPQTLSDQAVPLSADIRVINTDDGKARAKLAKSMRKWDINADIELLLQDKVRFEGFGLSSDLSGQLRLQQQKQRGLQAHGEIDLKAGGNKEPRYEAYGQKLTIRQGRLLFAGPVTQPALSIEAVKTVGDKVVGVRVEGRANSPTMQLISDTPMTQDEMLGYLLIGRPLYQEGRLSVGGGNDTALLTSAALSLGIRGGQGIASDIGNIVGLEDVSLDAEGSGDDTSFTVSGYLSPRLYLRYGVGVFTPVSKVTLRYKINQSLYLEAVSSLENALDLFYNLKY